MNKNKEKLNKLILEKEYTTQHKSIHNIANKYKLGYGTVQRLLHSFKIQVRPPIANSGEYNNLYKDGRCLKEYFCNVCNKQVSLTTALYGDCICFSCAMKTRIGIKRPEHSKLMTENNPFKGKHHTKENKKEQSILASKRIGELSHAWKGGKSFEDYSIEFNESLKEQIRARDHHECQKCNVRQNNSDRELCVHHIDYDKENCNEENLISLCLNCHVKTNGNREYWTKYFQEIIQKIYYLIK